MATGMVFAGHDSSSRSCQKASDAVRRGSKGMTNLFECRDGLHLVTMYYEI